MSERSMWAAESFGQVCVAYLTLHASADDWPDASRDLAKLRTELAQQAHTHRHDPVFFDYLAGRATIGGANGLGGRGLHLACRALHVSGLAPAPRLPRGHADWRNLIGRLHHRPKRSDASPTNRPRRRHARDRVAATRCPTSRRDTP